MKGNDDLYVTGIAVAQFYYGAERLGLPCREILLGVGLDESALQPLTHVPTEKFEALIMDLVMESGDEMLGFHCGLQVMPMMLGVFPSLVFGSMSVRDVLITFTRYQALVFGNTVGITASESGNDLKISFFQAYRNAVARRHATEGGATILINALRYFLGRTDLALRGLALSHQPASDDAKRQLEAFHQCPIQFGAAETSAEMDEKLLDIQLSAAVMQAGNVAEAVAREQLQQHERAGLWLSRVRIIAMDLMRKRSLRRELIADRLKISTRTLDRRLAEEGMSWQQLVDGMRSRRAGELVMQGEATIKAVARELGFSDVRGFQRRFRHWFGVSPSEYRREKKAL